MKKELEIFLIALMFYTRIPCPAWVGHSEELLEKSTKYFPLIGYIVGGIAVIVLYLSQLILPVSVSIILSMLAGILTTGAFHEDGLADVCDGFGGGWTKARILEIMKDSRIGTYGVVGLVLVLLSKYILSLELANNSLDFYLLGAAIFIGHTLSRLTATSMILVFEYARDDATSKTKPLAKRLTLKQFSLAVVFGLLPLAIFAFQWSFYAFLVLLPLWILMIFLGRFYKKWIGGFTGDCLGSVQQLSEILIYIFILGLWKFI